MIFDLSNPYEHERFKSYVNKLYTQRAVVEVKKKPVGRTLSQNSYLHLLISYFACEIGYTADEAKLEFFKKKCNRDLFARTRVNKLGQEVTYMRSSSELTTAEMTTAIERFRNYAASEACIYLPDANEQGFILHAQQEVERNKEFI